MPKAANPSEGQQERFCFVLTGAGLAAKTPPATVSFKLQFLLWSSFLYFNCHGCRLNSAQKQQNSYKLSVSTAFLASATQGQTKVLSDKFCIVLGVNMSSAFSFPGHPRHTREVSFDSCLKEKWQLKENKTVMTNTYPTWGLGQVETFRQSQTSNRMHRIPMMCRKLCREFSVTLLIWELQIFSCN